MLRLCNVSLCINIHFISFLRFKKSCTCDILILDKTARKHAQTESDLSMSEQKSKFKDALERYRNREKTQADKNLWKTRLLFLAPFIIAAIIFLLLSLD